MNTAGRLGRLAPHPEETHPRLKLGPFLRLDELPPIPAVIDWVSEVTDWPVYLNDRIGCCTCSAAGHMIEAWTRYGEGATVEVTDHDILTAYSAVSGYDPATGANDNGAVMQDVLGYWAKTGVGGHRILAYAQLDVHSMAEVNAALYLFGHVYVGLNVPASAIGQFNAGQPWDAVADDGGIQGGHAVDLGATGRVVTWGRVQGLTPAFWSRYVEEAWVVFDEEWVAIHGTNPAGVDLAALNAAAAALTGQPGPFPLAPTPPTPPAPPPSPSPVPPSDADLRLAHAAQHWLREPHVLRENRTMAEALHVWLLAHGFSAVG